VNARSWRQAASRSQGSVRLYHLLNTELQGGVGARISQLRRENAKYITSLPSGVALQLVEELGRATAQGARPETISKMARKRFPALLRSRVNLIGRTEAAKANAALTRARAESLGLPWYIWLSSRDQRTRQSHKKMDNVLVAYNDPPSPEALIGERSTLGTYNAGECPNCRCTQAVMLTLDDVNWPHRVYSHGKITTMTRAQFSAVTGITERRTAA